MTRPEKDLELQVKGLRLGAKFALSTSLALTAVMAVAGILMVPMSERIAREAVDRRVAESLKLTVRELRLPNFVQTDQRVIKFPPFDVWRFDVDYGLEEGKRLPAYLYEYRDADEAIDTGRLLVPRTKVETKQGMVSLIARTTLAVILVGALVSFLIAIQVSKPLVEIVEDIKEIMRGGLRRRSRVRGGGEIALLARVINSMAEGLEEAQVAQLELSMREREMAVADEVREALHPERAPVIEGYDLAAHHVGSPQPGGDFHDFIELEDGRVGLLVCGVSGQGVPGALVGATARSYLRSELARAERIDTALCRVNRFLARDMRRGMYVTAMYVLLDPRKGTAHVACAGHKVALLRISGADRKLRAVQPEGIALGFDRGPVFERTLQVLEIPVEPGDRLLLSNTGAMAVLDAEGRELGEKAFYRLVLKSAGLGSAAMLEALEAAFYQYAGETPLPNDISIITVARKA